MESLPPSSPFVGVGQEGKSSFLVVGQLQIVLPVYLYPSEG